MKKQTEKVERLETKVERLVRSEREAQSLIKEITELKSSLLVGQAASKLEQEIVKLLLSTITLNQLSRAVRAHPDHMSKAAFTRLHFKSNQVSGICFHLRMYSVHTYPCTPKLLLLEPGYDATAIHACLPSARTAIMC